MRSVKYLVAAGAASLLSSAAFAADMPSIMPPPPQQYYAPPAQDFGGWYLRGDIGMTNTRGKLDNSLLYPTAQSLQQVGQGFSGGTSFGVGVGYQFNSWFRADITGEYRSKVNFTGTDYSMKVLPPGIVGGGNATQVPFADSYNGGVSSWVGLVNAYADLGTWWCLTPFVGVGVGGAYNKTSGFSDLGTSAPTYFTGTANRADAGALYNAAGAGKFNFAWALHAGVAYKVTNNFTVELAYRYLDMGTAVQGFGSSFDGTNAGPSSFQFRDLTSQDVKIGVRWTCCDVEPPPPPLIRKG
jgi:opacity protein-like surface antigen